MNRSYRAGQLPFFHHKRNAAFTRTLADGEHVDAGLAQNRKDLPRNPRRMLHPGADHGDDGYIIIQLHMLHIPSGHLGGEFCFNGTFGAVTTLFIHQKAKILFRRRLRDHQNTGAGLGRRQKCAPDDTRYSLHPPPTDRDHGHMDDAGYGTDRRFRRFALWQNERAAPFRAKGVAHPGGDIGFHHRLHGARVQHARAQIRQLTHFAV
ncbi:MAG: hypothetical protein OXG09_09020 [Chloroflexi bacterium]|nr:hypothetical protein [Chloroflexota bacterium]